MADLHHGLISGFLLSQKRAQDVFCGSWSSVNTPRWGEGGGGGSWQRGHMDSWVVPVQVLEV